MEKLSYLLPEEIKCHNRGRVVHPCEHRTHPIAGTNGNLDMGAVLQKHVGEVPAILAQDKDFIKFVDPQDFVLQRNALFDPWDCVTCAHQTAIYAVYKSITGLTFPQQSRRFTAIRGGTQPGQGTSDYAVEQSILNDGMIPEANCISMTPTMTAAEFFAGVDLNLLTFEDFKKFFDVIFWKIPTRDGVSAPRFNLVSALLYTGIIVTVDGEYDFDPNGYVISAAQSGGTRPVTSDSHDVFLGKMTPNGVGFDEVIDSENPAGIVKFNPQYDYHYPVGVYLKKKSMFVKLAGHSALFSPSPTELGPSGKPALIPYQDGDVYKLVNQSTAYGGVRTYDTLAELQADYDFGTWIASKEAWDPQAFINSLTAAPSATHS